MISDEDMWSDISNRLKQIQDTGHKKLVEFFVANKLKKDQIKNEIEFVDTAFLEHYLYDVFIGMEEYEICQAFKEVLDERDQNPEQLQRFAEFMIQREMAAIAKFREISKGIDLGSWDGLYSALDDFHVMKVFKVTYPVGSLIKLEMVYFKNRQSEGSEVFVDYEIKGDELLSNTSLFYKLQKIYPETNIQISEENNFLIFVYADSNNNRFMQRYQDFDFIEEKLIFP